MTTAPNVRNRYIAVGTPAPTPPPEYRALRVDRCANDSYSPILKQASDLASTQTPDPFSSFYARGDSASPIRIIEPNFSLEELAKITLEDVTLASCIDAMASNVSGFGYTLEYIGPDNSQDSSEAIKEKSTLIDLLDRCNPDESIANVLGKVDRDYNTFGHAYLEVGRDLKGNVDFVYHIPAQTMRATVVDGEPQPVEVWLRRDGVLTKKKAKKRFRRFVQITPRTTERVYFKEFGDGRIISSETGMEGANIALEDEAVEVIWLNKYTPGFSYGLPNFVACIAAIIGSREAALTNLDFFKDNAIPALAVLVSGGVLSQDAVDSLKGQLTKGTGRRMVNRAIILEARAPEEDQVDPTSNPPVPRLDIKPLTQERQGDALFQAYTVSNSNQIRQSFRLPPLLVGLATDYTRATAESSLDMAEAQVFGPERRMLDDIVNSKLLLREGKPPMYWRYRSNSPRLSSSEAQLVALGQLEAVGAMTPNTAITIANSVFGMHIPAIKEPWGELPFTFTSGLVSNDVVRPETGLADSPTPEPSVPPKVSQNAPKDPLPSKPKK